MSEHRTIGEVVALLEQVRATVIELQSAPINTDPASVLAWAGERYQSHRSDEWQNRLQADLNELTRAVNQHIGSAVNSIKGVVARAIAAQTSRPTLGFVPLNVQNTPPSVNEVTIGESAFVVVSVGATPKGHPLRDLPASARVGGGVCVGTMQEIGRNPDGSYRLPAVVAVEYLEANATRFRAAEEEATEVTRKRLEAERAAKVREREQHRLNRPLTVGDVEKLKRELVTAK